MSNLGARSYGAALIALFALGGAAAPSAAQFGDWDGTFVVKKPAPGVIPDTVLGSGESLTWIRHDGKSRIAWSGDYGDLIEEVGIESGTIAFTRAGGAAIKVFVSAKGDDDGNYWWEFAVGDGSVKQRWRFDRPTKPIDPDDLKPRAKLPPTAYADSVVLAVRSLYQRVDTFRCTPPADSDGIPADLQVCALGGWTGRIKTDFRIEVTRMMRSYTFDSTGALRFVFDVTEQPGFQKHQRYESRYYFARGHLVRVVLSRNGGAAKNWEPSEDAWREAETTQLKRAAYCLSESGSALKAVAADTLVVETPDECRF